MLNLFLLLICLRSKFGPKNWSQNLSENEKDVNGLSLR